MKIKIKTKDINKINNTFNQVINSISHKIENTGLLIEVYENKILFQGKNWDLNLLLTKNESDVLEIKEEGTVLVKMRIFSEIISKIKDDEIEIWNIEENVLNITTKNDKYEINLLNQKKFERTNINIKNETKKITIENKVFKDMINTISFSGDEKNPRKILQGINIRTENKKIVGITSDDTRVATFKGGTIYSDEMNKIIPLKVSKEIVKILNGDQSNLYFTNRSLIIINDDLKIKTSLIEGNYPNVQKIFNFIGDKKLVMKRTEIFNIFDRATSFNLNKLTGNMSVKLSIKSDELSLSSNEIELGSSFVRTKSFSFNSNENFQINFNPRFLIEALKYSEINSDIEIIFDNSEKPFVVSELGNNNYKSLILPFKSF